MIWKPESQMKEYILQKQVEKYSPETPTQSRTRMHTKRPLMKENIQNYGPGQETRIIVVTHQNITTRDQMLM